MRIAIAIVALALMPVAASAQDSPTARLLYEACTADESDLVSRAFCTAYASGWLGAWIVLETRGGSSGDVCFPDEVTVAQIRRVFVRWLEENPRYEHEDPEVAMLYATLTAFPCEPL